MKLYMHECIYSDMVSMIFFFLQQKALYVAALLTEIPLKCSLNNCEGHHTHT